MSVAKKFTFDEDLKFQSGHVAPLRIVTSSTTLSNTSGPRGAQTASDGLDGGYDYMLAIDTSSSAITVTLPITTANGMTPGRVYYIFDYTGNAATEERAITIDPGSGNTIQGESTATINTDYATLTIKNISSGAWQIV